MDRRDLLAGVGHTGLLSLVGASPVGAAAPRLAPPRKGGTLVVTLSGEPSYLVSAFDPTITICLVGSKVMEGLVTYDVNLNPQPALAKSWTVSKDGLTIAFALRENVKWHDGADFTSADVAFTLLNVWKVLHPFGRAAYATVTSVDTPDPHTVVLHLSAPAKYLFNYFNTYGSQVLPKHLYEGKDIRTNPVNSRPVGTGPFIFKEWQRGSHVRLERNPHYWRPGLPYFDAVVFRFIPDAAARAVALQAGEVQLVIGSGIAPSDIDRFSDRSRYWINTTDGNFQCSMSLAFFNVRRPHFKDRRVRQAFLHAIDRESIVRILYRGYGKVATGPIPSSLTKFYTSKTPQYPFNPARAEALLDAAGLKRGPDGVRLRIFMESGTGVSDESRLAQLVKQYLKRVGIEVQIRNADLPNFLRRIFTDQDFDFVLTGLHMLSDPQLGVQRIYWTKNIAKGVIWSNGSGYSNPVLDKVMEAAAREPDDTKRRALIWRWQEICQEDVPVLDLMERSWVTVGSNRLVRPSLQGDGLFETLADAYFAG